MRFGFGKTLRVFLGVAGLAMLLSAPAQASTALYLAEDLGAVTQVAITAGQADLAFSGVFNDFNISFLATHQDNGALLSDLLSSTVSVTNQSGAQHTLHLWVTSQDYTLPTGPNLLAESAMGGSVSTGTVTPSFQAYADKNNGLLGIGDFTSGNQNAAFNGSSFDTGSAFGVFARLVGNYSMTTVTHLVMSGGARANFSSHENMRPVPEPASMLLIGSGLVGLASKVRRRMRKA